ncbi:MAG: hypothetical protein MUP53_08700 [Bacteroidales bacterium]|nr:hypothetical protein [Bacteroidales bacterium]
MDVLKKEAATIQAYLDIVCSNNPEELTERISQLMAYMSRSGEMLAEAKRLLRSRKSEEIRNTIIAVAKAERLSASVQNALLDSICEQEAFLANWLDRVNKSCTHQIEGLRSLLSYEKEGLRLNKTGY